MLDLRLFRASLIPFLAMLAIVAFSVHPLPAALTSGIPAASFGGARAFNLLEHLEARFPRRRAGSAADRELGALIATRLAGDGYAVQTAAGVVLATQPGSGPGSLVLLADRSGNGAAALSGTAALLELARDLTARGSLRPIAFVSTDGATVPRLPGRVAAAIVLGDLAGTAARHPFEIPFSNVGSAAPLALQQTLTHWLPGSPGRPDLLDQLAQFALPFSPTAQAALLDAGIPAVLAQQSGESGPPANEPVSRARLAAFGSAIASTLAALERAPSPAPATRDLTLSGDRLGGWSVRALVAALLFATALPALDVFARARRRRVALARSLAWLLLWAAPVGATLLFAKLLGALGALGALPASPALLAPGTRGVLILVTTLAFFALACLARVRLIKWPSREPDGPGPGAAVAVICVATALALALWMANPYTAALLALPLVFWLPLLTAEREHERHPWAVLAWLALSLVPLGGVLAVEAVGLQLGPLRFTWSWLVLLASGQLGVGGFLALSLTGGLFLAAATLLMRSNRVALGEELRLTTRGPITYAGPGSLGGTPSAR